MHLTGVDYLQSDNREVTLTPLIPEYYVGLSEIAHPDFNHLNLFETFWDDFNSTSAIAKTVEESKKSATEWLAILGRGVIVGAIYAQRLHFNRPTINTGYWVASPFTNNGFATEAVILLSDHVIERELTNTVIASPQIRNIHSVRVLETAGFVGTQEYRYRSTGNLHRIYEKTRK